MKINRSFINLKSFKKFVVLVLSFRLLPFVQSTVNDLENDNQTSDLSTLESMRNDVVNRDYFLSHINQLNSNYGDRFNRLNNHPQFRYNNKSSYVDDRPKNVLTKRIALLANFFGKSDSDEEKKEKPSENQTDNKSSDSLKKENATITDNKDSNQSILENQSNYLKNHLQSDKQIETINRLLNISKTYENWQDHLKNQHALNNHRQDFINLLHLNNTNFSDLLSTSSQNSTNEQDQTKSKNVFIFSPETYPGKSLLVENNQFGFKPNNLISSLLVSNGHDYFPRSNQGETITEASDLNSEYNDESNKDEDDDKQIDNRNENGLRRKYFKGRLRQNAQPYRQKFVRNKMRKNFDDQYSRIPQNSGFRPISMDKLLKEQSQISASTGVKKSSTAKSKQTTADANDTNKVKRVNSTTTSLDLDYNQLSVSNQPFTIKPHAYKFPTNNYGKRLNELLNNQANRKQNLVSSNNNKNVVINTATIESTTATSIDQLDEDNNEQVKEDILNEHDKQLITDKTKELFEKNDDSSDLQLNDYETNKDSDLKTTNNDLINTHQLSYNQAIDANLLNQQQQIANQAELDSSENDSIENENDLNNPISQSGNQTKESDLDSSNKAKFLINELNKVSKQDKNQLSSKSKQQNKKTNWKQLNSNYKHYKIYDKYSKLNSLNGMNSNFNFDQNYPMNTYLSNENFKINLSNGKSDLEDDITMSNLIPYPTPQYNKQTSFSNLYYPLIKKKPFYSSPYPNYGFSMNPLNGMLFDKLNSPLDNYSPIEKLPSISGPIKDKNNLDNKFYNLDNKLHHLNSKYSLNSLTPPYNLPLPLEGKYYEPKGHYDSKYHSIGNWQSGLAGFLLGVVPFSLMMASMVPTISAISSGGAAAAALGRRRRSVNENLDGTRNRTVNQIESSIENSNCLIRLSKIIESINNLIQVKEFPNQVETKIYFDQLIELQRQCELNIKLPIDFNERIRKFLSFKADKNDKNWRKESNTFYLYDLNGGKFNWLDSIFNFFTSFLSGNDYDYQFRLNNTDNHDRVDYHTSTNSDQVFSIFHFKEMKCLQETVCKVLLSPNFKKSLFSNVASILANITPKKLINKYGLNIIVDGITTNRCVTNRSFCQN